MKRTRDTGAYRVLCICLLAALMLFGVAGALAETSSHSQSIQSAIRGDVERPADLTSIALNHQDMRVQYGDQLQLELIGDTAGIAQVLWSSSEETLLVVERDGFVRCVGALAADAKATVSATVITWDGKSTKLDCQFTVVADSKVNVESVEQLPISTKKGFLREELYLYPGEEFTLAPTLPAGTKLVSVQSSDPKVASVNTMSSLTALEPGATVITMEVSGTPVQHLQTNVVVLPAFERSSAGPRLALSELTLWPGEKIKPAYSLPDGATGSLTWSSDDPKIAAVTSDGVISTVGAGGTLVRAKTSDGRFETAFWVDVPGIEVDMLNAAGANAQGIISNTSGVVQLREGERFVIPVKLLPEDFRGLSITAVVDNPNALAVDGLTITARTGSGGQTATVTIIGYTKNGIVMTSLKVQVIAEVTPSPSPTATTRPSGGGSSGTRTGLALTPSSMWLPVGGTGRLYASYTPSGASASVTYTSSNRYVATVSSNGTVTGHSFGTAIITAWTTDGRYSASSLVTVGTFYPTYPPIPTPVPPVVVSISLNPSALTMEVDETANIATTLTPDLSSATVSYVSSNPGVASIESSNRNGLVVKAHASGTAVITATTSSGGRTVSATCIITVNVPVTDIEVLYPSSLSMLAELGQSYDLKARVLPLDATNQGLVWESSNASVVSVDANGRITVHAVADHPINIRVSSAANPGVYKDISVQPVQKIVTQLVVDSPQIVYLGVADQQIGVTVLPAGVAAGDRGFTAEYVYADRSDVIEWTPDVSPTTWVPHKVGRAVVRFTSIQNPDVSVLCRVIVVHPPITDIVIDAESAPDTMTAGVPATKPLEAELITTPAGGTPDPTNSTITWSIEQTGAKPVLRIEPDGTLFPIREGTATLVATAGGVTVRKTITVVWDKAIFKVEPVNTTLYASGTGNTAKLTATVVGEKNGYFCEDNDYRIEWPDGKTHVRFEDNYADDHLRDVVALNYSGVPVPYTATMVPNGDGPSATADFTINVVWPIGPVTFTLDTQPSSNELVLTYQDDTGMLYLTATNGDGSPAHVADIRWHFTAGDDYATVAPDGSDAMMGEVTAVKPGSGGGVYVTATVNGTRLYTQTFPVRVSYLEDTSPDLTIRIDETTLPPMQDRIAGTGDTWMLEADILPEGWVDLSRYMVRWLSDDTSVATVNRDSGELELVGAGTAEITASLYLKDGTPLNKSHTVSITVENDTVDRFWVEYPAEIRVGESVDLIVHIETTNGGISGIDLSTIKVHWLEAGGAGVFTFPGAANKTTTGEYVTVTADAAGEKTYTASLPDYPGINSYPVTLNAVDAEPISFMVIPENSYVILNGQQEYYLTAVVTGENGLVPGGYTVKWPANNDFFDLVDVPGEPLMKRIVAKQVTNGPMPCEASLVEYPTLEDDFTITIYDAQWDYDVLYGTGRTPSANVNSTLELTADDRTKPLELSVWATDGSSPAVTDISWSYRLGEDTTVASISTPNPAEPWKVNITANMTGQTVIVVNAKVNGEPISQECLIKVGYGKIVGIKIDESTLPTDLTAGKIVDHPVSLADPYITEPADWPYDRNQSYRVEWDIRPKPTMNTITGTGDTALLTMDDELLDTIISARLYINNATYAGLYDEVTLGDVNWDEPAITVIVEDDPLYVGKRTPIRVEVTAKNGGNLNPNATYTVVWSVEDNVHVSELRFDPGTGVSTHVIADVELSSVNCKVTLTSSDGHTASEDFTLSAVEDDVASLVVVSLDPVDGTFGVIRTGRVEVRVTMANGGSADHVQIQWPSDLNYRFDETSQFVATITALSDVAVPRDSYMIRVAGSTDLALQDSVSLQTWWDVARSVALSPLTQTILAATPTGQISIVTDPVDADVRIVQWDIDDTMLEITTDSGRTIAINALKPGTTVVRAKAWVNGVLYENLEAEVIIEEPIPSRIIITDTQFPGGHGAYTAGIAVPGNLTVTFECDNNPNNFPLPIADWMQYVTFESRHEENVEVGLTSGAITTKRGEDSEIIAIFDDGQTVLRSDPYAILMDWAEPDHIVLTASHPNNLYAGQPDVTVTAEVKAASTGILDPSATYDVIFTDGAGNTQYQFVNPTTGAQNTIVTADVVTEVQTTGLIPCEAYLNGNSAVRGTVQMRTLWDGIASVVVDPVHTKLGLVAKKTITATAVAEHAPHGIVGPVEFLWADLNGVGEPYVFADFTSVDEVGTATVTYANKQATYKDYVLTARNPVSTATSDSFRVETEWSAVRIDMNPGLAMTIEAAQPVQRLWLTATPADQFGGYDSIEWVSDDPATVKVNAPNDQDEVQIEALKPGTATITANIFVNGEPYTLTCDITVNPPTLAGIRIADDNFPKQHGDPYIAGVPVNGNLTVEFIPGANPNNFPLPEAEWLQHVTFKSHAAVSVEIDEDTGAVTTHQGVNTDVYAVYDDGQNPALYADDYTILVDWAKPDVIDVTVSDPMPLYAGQTGVTVTAEISASAGYLNPSATYSVTFTDDDSGNQYLFTGVRNGGANTTFIADVVTRVQTNGSIPVRAYLNSDSTVDGTAMMQTNWDALDSIVVEPTETKLGLVDTKTITARPVPAHNGGLVGPVEYLWENLTPVKYVFTPTAVHADTTSVTYIDKTATREDFILTARNDVSTATSNTFTVTTEYAPVTVSMNPANTMTIEAAVPKQSLWLTAAPAADFDDFDSISWASSDDTIVRINGATDGDRVEIEALKPGTVTITATVEYNGKTDTVTCTVTVNPPILRSIEITDAQFPGKHGPYTAGVPIAGNLWVVFHTENNPNNFPAPETDWMNDIQFISRGATDVAIDPLSGVVTADRGVDTNVYASYKYGQLISADYLIEANWAEPDLIEVTTTGTLPLYAGQKGVTITAEVKATAGYLDPSGTYDVTFTDNAGYAKYQFDNKRQGGSNTVWVANIVTPVDTAGTATVSAYLTTNTAVEGTLDMQTRWDALAGVSVTPVDTVLGLIPSKTLTATPVALHAPDGLVGPVVYHWNDIDPTSSTPYSFSSSTTSTADVAYRTNVATQHTYTLNASNGVSTNVPSNQFTVRTVWADVNITLSPSNSLTIEATTPTATLELIETPVSGGTFAGYDSILWKTEDASVVVINGSATDEVVTLRAIGPGTTRVYAEIKVNGVTDRIYADVTVNPPALVGFTVDAPALAKTDGVIANTTGYGAMTITGFTWEASTFDMTSYETALRSQVQWTSSNPDAVTVGLTDGQISGPMNSGNKSASQIYGTIDGVDSNKVSLSPRWALVEKIIVVAAPQAPTELYVGTDYINAIEIELQAERSGQIDPAIVASPAVLWTKNTASGSGEFSITPTPMNGYSASVQPTAAGPASYTASISGGMAGHEAVINLTALPTVLRSVLSPSATTLDIGDTADFTFTAYDSKGNPVAPTSVTWTIADTTVVDYGDPSGYVDESTATVEALSPVKTTVKVVATFAGNQTETQTATINVNYAIVDSVTITASPTDTEAFVGLSLDGKLAATINYSPTGSTPEPGKTAVVKWRSLDTSVATVNSDTGKLTFVGPGLATIEAQAYVGGVAVGTPDTASFDVNYDEVDRVEVDIPAGLYAGQTNGVIRATLYTAHGGERNPSATYTASWTDGNSDATFVFHPMGDGLTARVEVKQGVTENGCVVTVTKGGGGTVATNTFSMGAIWDPVDEVRISPPQMSLSINGSQQLYAEIVTRHADGIPGPGAMSIGWDYSGTTLIEILPNSVNGKSVSATVTAKASGTEIVKAKAMVGTATYYSTGSCTVTVGSAIDNIALTATPADQIVYAQTTMPTVSLTADLTSAGLPATTPVNWSVSGSAVGTVNTSLTGTTNTLTLSGEKGSVEVIAVAGGKTARYTVQVKYANVVSVTVTANDAITNVLDTGSYTATVVTQPSGANYLIDDVTWSVSSGNLSLNPNGANKTSCNVAANYPVTDYLTASVGGQSGGIPLTVSDVIVGLKLNTSVLQLYRPESGRNPTTGVVQVSGVITKCNTYMPVPASTYTWDPLTNGTSLAGGSGTGPSITYQAVTGTTPNSYSSGKVTLQGSAETNNQPVSQPFYVVVGDNVIVPTALMAGAAFSSSMEEVQETGEMKTALDMLITSETLEEATSEGSEATEPTEDEADVEAPEAPLETEDPALDAQEMEQQGDAEASADEEALAEQDEADDLDEASEPVEETNDDEDADEPAPSDILSQPEPEETMDPSDIVNYFPDDDGVIQSKPETPVEPESPIQPEMPSLPEMPTMPEVPNTQPPAETPDDGQVVTNVIWRDVPDATLYLGQSGVRTRIEIMTQSGEIADRPVWYQTNNAAVATISDDGVITPRGTGEARITASVYQDGEWVESEALTIAVAWDEVTGFTLSDGALLLSAGETRTIGVTWHTAHNGEVNPRTELVITTADPFVAYAKDGVIIAAGAGSTTLGVEGYADGARVGSAAISVMVTGLETQPDEALANPTNTFPGGEETPGENITMPQPGEGTSTEDSDGYTSPTEAFENLPWQGTGTNENDTSDGLIWSDPATDASQADSIQAYQESASQQDAVESTAPTTTMPPTHWLWNIRK